jgi:CubicO group peptidase (beta-lactamase class C family)
MNGFSDLDKYFSNIVDQNKIPGVVAAALHKNQLIYHQAFGKMDVANNIEMQEDSLFQIASLTKPITSTAVMMLVEAGKLKLDDPISQYIPSLLEPKIITRFNDKDASYVAKHAEKEITIRHLLTHTAGFGYGFSNNIWNALIEKTGNDEEALPLLHEPGSKWTYSMGTRILGKMIESISGVSLEEYFKTNIFSPLQMHDSYFVIPEEKLIRWVTKHERLEGIPIEKPNPELPPVFILGDGGLYSTAKDYIIFLQMLLNGGMLNDARILKEDSVTLMTQNHIGELVVETQPGAIPNMSDAFPSGAGKDKFGLGFQISEGDADNENLRSPGSYSWSGLYNTHFWVDPKKEIAAVIMMQMLPFYNEACISACQNFERLIYTHIDQN